MRPVNNNPETYSAIMKVGKRIAITILVCVPFLIVFAYLMRNIITSNVVLIICFVLIMGIAVLIEEIIARKREKVKKETIVEKRDVFK